MSEPLRIAVVVEGPTDAITIEAIVGSLRQGADFEFQTLQPEWSIAFGPPGDEMGLGWSGVYRWCRQASDEGDGSASGSAAMAYHDVIVVHVDADVAGKTYASASIHALRDDLPCEEPCPPASRTTNALRKVVLGWLGESDLPTRLVLCTPSKNMDAWVVPAVWPENQLARHPHWECRSDPASQLAAMPASNRFRKRIEDYARRSHEIEIGWSRVATRLTEAIRFHGELRAATR